jgi:hypothetical protein
MVALLAVGAWQLMHPTAAVRNVISTQSSPISRAAQLTGLPDASSRQSLHHYPAFPSSMASDPIADPLARLLQDLQAESDPLKREQLIANFLAGLKNADLAATLALLQHATPAELAGDLSRRVVRTWADSNPQAVAAWIDQQPAGDQRQLASDNLAIVWANSQLSNAINWGQSLTDVDERNRVLTAVANEAVRADAATALQLAVTLPADSQRDDLVRRAATEWASGDAPTAVSWAEQIPDPTLRDSVLAWRSRNYRPAGCRKTPSSPLSNAGPSRRRKRPRPGWINSRLAPCGRSPSITWSPNGPKRMPPGRINGWPIIPDVRAIS